MSLRNLRSAAYRWVLYPGVLALRGESDMYEVLDNLRTFQWAEPEELREYQREKVRGLLEYAYRSVPYYRHQWGKEPLPSEVDPLDWVRRLPRLTKTELQESREDLMSKERPSRLSKKTTGGSTGEPVTVLKDRDALARERAASWLCYGWFGVEIGDLGARFWGSPTGFRKRRFRYAMADAVMNRIRFSAFSFDEEDLEEYWRKCLRVEPDYFYGYVSMLTEFARYLEAQEYDGGQLGLKTVITTAEALSGPQRSLLEDVLCAPVQNEYGCGEVGPIAYECPEGRLHTMSTNLLVEIIAEDGRRAEPGESGEVVVTDLNNHAMPLVRYRVGDRAVRGEACPCGRGFPVLEEITGRAYDFVEDTTGRRYHGEYFMYLFEDLRERGASVGRFRLRQVSDRELVVEMVHPSGGLSQEDERFLRDRLRRDMPEMDVRIQYRENMERAPSGKTRVIRNDWHSSRQNEGGESGLRSVT